MGGTEGGREGGRETERQRQRDRERQRETERQSMSRGVPCLGVFSFYFETERQRDRVDESVILFEILGFRHYRQTVEHRHTDCRRHTDRQREGGREWREGERE